MAKKTQKAQKGSGSRVQTHLHARIAYLYKATNYLQSATSTKRNEDDSQSQRTNDTSSISKQNASKESQPRPSDKKKLFSSIARQYGAQLRSVSLKSQLRLNCDIKRSICKRCDSLLRLGLTCSETIENKSRGKKKPWADTQVIICGFCGTRKRFPQGSKKNIKLVDRQKV
ncbi:RNAse P Rpr2/Rpp21 subunit domain-containing protein [Microsporum canis CBS 113480]|uniref:RNAse P Rpr2/Rpp21 subunit domain-containing protein n=1 Tax=Arthroderma otae (strain ATCC MYA-4605 / CBS 113480) TaxID=554155 RepID=C5FKL0_ARTOC|nr:RNAse P Rpr2/Rpp21 subunit domain-containing protein [Microsporum canis CBS 113480]EEQ30232.1 RNAse P Rpr2/Rpp21 subunit domain-containing protein [Microsporum canis CBS 113480]